MHINEIVHELARFAADPNELYMPDHQREVREYLQEHRDVLRAGLTRVYDQTDDATRREAMLEHGLHYLAWHAGFYRQAQNGLTKVEVGSPVPVTPDDLLNLTRAMEYALKINGATSH